MLQRTHEVPATARHGRTSRLSSRQAAWPLATGDPRRAENLPVTHWPKRDQAAWARPRREGELFGERGLAAHWVAARAQVENGYGMWMHFLYAAQWFIAVVVRHGGLVARGARCGRSGCGASACSPG